MKIISRSQWGARPAHSVQKVAVSDRRRFVVHYSAASPDQTPKAIQAYHMHTRGWADVGYNFLVNADGEIFEGRGWDVLGAHASGYNTESIGVCFIGRDRDAGPKVLAAVRWLYDEACRRTGRTLTRTGHRDLAATACPGDELHVWLRAGMPVDGPPPSPSPSRPAPGPAVPFPLPSGYYFGPKAGGDRSVSGYYRRTFKGKADRTWLAQWAGQLVRRGWPAGKGQRYLRRSGRDGIYGPEYQELIKAFQKDQGLRVDGLLGVQTWDAAYRNPIT
ncbi:peptidoglycan-binding domain-containing protein [Salinispora vitiensis]|uniref:peptidoglycan-binding domain-containing protein n=1 Tax=Salinispora vitiensis TaxID=999544 RepID=UPI0003665852|nr:peptidoglycan-binding domain-containing protein [Salinispora vitiensis]